MKHLEIADLFCGAGGTSAGAVEAIESLGYGARLTAINHWDVAIATHTANHPEARHLCTSLDNINPRDLFEAGKLDLLWASPECTHHSVARGGMPINDQSRSTAWCVVRWAEALRPGVVLVENVPEFETWGAIGTNGRPLKGKRGATFLAWVGALESLGYSVDWRVLCAADYGDPTTRKRLFVQCVRGRRKIVWPEPTHGEVIAEDMYSQRKQWVPARDIIDWSVQGTSIYDRKRPLSPKTMKRIMAGLEKFGLKPFITPGQGERQTQTPRTHDVDAPAPTVTAQGHLHMAEPFLITMEHAGSVRDIKRPLPTITTAKGGAIAVAEPFLVQVAHGNGADANGDKRRSRSLGLPLPTVCGERGEWAFIEPHLLPQQSDGALRPCSQPSPTVATAGAIALVQPFIISAGGPECAARGVSEPVGTVLTRDHRALVAPYLVEYYGNGRATSVDVPLGTATTKARFGLARPIVVIEGERYLLDIRFRMLQPKELAAAQGFRRDYQFTGNKTEQVKQIGNAVPRNLARALVLAAVGQDSDVGKFITKEAA